MSIFKGAGVALLTPFNEDNTINFEELGKIIEDQIAGGTDALIVCGTTGEPATMSYEERQSVIEFAVKTVNKRIPVIAGTGANSTHTAIKLSEQAKEVGADAILVVTPFYNKCTQAGLYEHYKAVATAVDLPIIMYNVPSRTGCNILPETAIKLAKEFENIVAIKEASGDISQIADLAAMNDGVLDIYSGNDDQVIPILSLGGIGVISVLSNVAPKDTHDMVMSYLEGNTKKALSLQLKYLNVIHALFSEVNPIPVKWAANIMGYKAGGLRLPLTELEESHKKELELAMKNACII
ncbi:4-hydroxy-tetrahydrodipicolinate synthase [Lachnobacterium bovis]|jgi:4-hydroxy-tetrahydrodipicolinate synthase|uniref:4-hydroxy-tetrahydrodipicolinate synthase n=1 Tax=Lachnobacterium bovis DSM 14045 TaxID=1122142 RepID=A0A1H3HLD3_9FIRM|nr:4-hydroxy-tetrahydrodipicolinate synthase [Lachnobacterium bovis]MBQ1801898.1 4-hydroxy-tetrahydrodipicolinate synthase [Lachnobacterium sp.]SDY16190.1 4-hydroxy-tetrahydrodipicolinate synthase [Lachnobacterium bovis DSM 14045]